MTFKVGDRVIMSDVGKERYEDQLSNPHNVEGVVTEVGDCEHFEWYLEVTWDNKSINDYRVVDLYHVMKRDVKIEDFL